MKPLQFTINDHLHEGQVGIWLHDGDRGAIEKMPYIRQFGNVKLTRIILDDNMGWHLNDGIEIHYVKKGNYEWALEGNNETLRVSPGDVSITAPWQVHASTMSALELGHITWIVLTPELFTNVGQLHLGEWCSLDALFLNDLGRLIAQRGGLVIKQGSSIGEYFDAIYDELRYLEANYEKKVALLIEAMLIDIYRRLAKNNPNTDQDPSLMNKLHELITNDIIRKWNVEELAEYFLMSKTSFTEKVKKITGYPPGEYILKLRIEHAKQMLTNTSETLVEIAYQNGFASPQHFVSSFKQKVGITPSAYRNRDSID